MINANKPANPTNISIDRDNDKIKPYQFSNDGFVSLGLTKKEKTCIELGVPETGDPELDKIIRKAERRDIAKAALKGILSNPEQIGDKASEIINDAVCAAYALLTELEE